MEKTDVRRGFGNELAIQFEHEPQNAVRGWMRWPHVEHHLLADIVLLPVRVVPRRLRPTRVTGSGDSISRVVNGIEG